MQGSLAEIRETYTRHIELLHRPRLSETLSISAAAYVSGFEGSYSAFPSNAGEGHMVCSQKAALLQGFRVMGHGCGGRRAGPAGSHKAYFAAHSGSLVYGLGRAGWNPMSSPLLLMI